MFDDVFGPESPARDGAEILAALKQAASERILVIDGAMGTQIQGLGFQEDHFAVIASLVAPVISRAITTF